ncbi:MAG TPA: C39 family peptidase, partial [Candidatus Hydrogenedentes bacterium]|nr:C39 family peptidase [Candidatus Hydrogenedentota bacterium]
MLHGRLLPSAVRVLALCLCLPAIAQVEPDQQSTTGPKPPAGCVLPPFQASKAAVTISGVPRYIWRHGCGPTAVGMVLGYYDTHGFDALFPGSAATQTPAVIQAIASGGTSSSPNPAGSEKHYEDYARPQDTYPSLCTDDYITQLRTPHTDNCIADFMDTSKSTRDNYYGWSWSSDIKPAYEDYVSLMAPTCTATATQYYYVSSLTYAVLKNEIDNNRPMVFLVDSDGDGGTDHFVTIVGYDESTAADYIFLSTWDISLHQATFQGMSSSYAWGVWGGWAFTIQGAG